MAGELGASFTVCETAQEVCAASDIIVTCTPGQATVLEKAWLKPGPLELAAAPSVVALTHPTASCCIVLTVGVWVGGGSVLCVPFPRHDDHCNWLRPADQAGDSRGRAREQYSLRIIQYKYYITILCGIKKTLWHFYNYMHAYFTQIVCSSFT